MKKSVVIIICICFLFSIFVVGFFGAAVEVDIEVKYVQYILVENDDAEKNYSAGINYIIEYDYAGEAIEYQIAWRVYPADADDTDVSFYANNQSVSVSANGIVVISEPVIFTVTITAAQVGTNVSTVLLFMPKS